MAAIVGAYHELGFEGYVRPDMAHDLG